MRIPPRLLLAKYHVLRLGNVHKAVLFLVDDVQRACGGSMMETPWVNSREMLVAAAMLHTYRYRAAQVHGAPSNRGWPSCASARTHANIGI